MADQRPDTDSRQLMPDDDWRAFFTPDALTPFTPRRGASDFVPLLEVHSLTLEGERQLVVMALALDNFNEWEARRQIMAELGRQWAVEGWRVYALRFGCEAWTRRFSEEEYAAREKGRLIETYDDKQEVMIVQGLTLDGRQGYGQAELLRDSVGRIRAVRPWAAYTSLDPTAPRMRVPLLTLALQSYIKASILPVNNPN